MSPLKVENLSKSFGTKLVLDDVSLDVPEGEIFGLIGLNGAGKTTLIKIILGLLAEDAGQATIFGESVAMTETRKKLCYLPEKFHPSFFLKGKEFLSLSLAYFGRKYDAERAKEGARLLDLDPDVLDWKITKYSKGMGQKLGLLSALLSDAPLLILDEPMSGLDPRARIRLKDNLMDYVKGGKTIFFSSHILSDIDEICGKIAILHNNKVIFSGTPAAFKKQQGVKNLERAFLNAIEAA